MWSIIIIINLLYSVVFHCSVDPLCVCVCFCVTLSLESFIYSSLSILHYQQLYVIHNNYFNTFSELPIINFSTLIVLLHLTLI